MSEPLDLDAIEERWRYYQTEGETIGCASVLGLVAELRRLRAERVPEHQLLLKAERERERDEARAERDALRIQRHRALVYCTAITHAGYEGVADMLRHLLGETP